MFQPIGPRIKVKLINNEEVTAGGIILTKQGGTEDAEIGEVVALGHMAYKNISDETPWVSVGDKVLFQRYAGKIDPTDANTRCFRYLKDIDIIAVDKQEN